MKKQKMILKDNVQKVLGWILGTYICFCSLTIESLGNPFYNRILFTYTILAIISFILLYKYSNIFDK